jgi:hypothetical protein
MKKYILILGIALLCSSIVGLFKPKVHYYRSKLSGAVELSKIDYEQYNYTKFKTTDVDFPLVILVFFTVLGAGLITSSITFRNKNSKLLNNNIPESSSIPAPSGKEDDQHTIDIGTQNQIINNRPPPINNVSPEPILTEKTNVSVIKKTDVSLGKKNHENHDWHLTFLIVLGISLVYATIMSITSSDGSFLNTKFISSLFVMALGSFIIGVLLASFAYLFTKEFESKVHKIIRITAIVFTVLAGGGSLMNYIETKADSNVVNAQIISNEIDQSPDQLYSNEYYSIKYPKGCKISNGKVQGYMHQIIFERPSTVPKDYYMMSIGILENKYGHNFDKKVYIEICLENTKKVVAGYNVDGSFSSITNQQIGIHQASKFRLTFPWNGMTTVEYDYVINNDKLVAVISFSSYIDDKVSLQNEIISSLTFK